MTSSISPRSLQRFPAVWLTALLGASGCGGVAGSPDSIAPPAAVGYAYVAASPSGAGNPGAVYEYALKTDFSASALAPVSIAAGVQPAAVAVGVNHVYVVNVGDGTVSQYNIQADHTLTPMNPAAVPNPGMKTLGVMPSAAIFDGTRSLLYVANSGDNTLSQFSIGSDGKLSPLTPATVAAGIAPTSMVTGITGSGRANVYVANSGAGVAGGAGSISQYVINLDGTLEPLAPGSVAIVGNPQAIVMVPGAAYVVNNCGSTCTGSVTQFAFGADGELTGAGSTAIAGITDGISMVLTPSGGNASANAYVLGNLTTAGTGALSQFGVASDGALTPANPPALNIGSTALAQALNFETLYVLTATAGVGGNNGSGTVTLNTYTLGTGGSPVLAAAATLAVPNPVSMGMFFLVAP